MLENADITIYHKWETGYTPIQIKNVCMRGRQESGFTGQNTSSSDEYTIRIYAAADTGKKEYICAKNTVCLQIQQTIGLYLPETTLLPGLLIAALKRQQN